MSEGVLLRAVVFTLGDRQRSRRGQREVAHPDGQRACRGGHHRGHPERPARRRSREPDHVAVHGNRGRTPAGGGAGGLLQPDRGAEL